MFSGLVTVSPAETGDEPELPVGDDVPEEAELCGDVDPWVEIEESVMFGASLVRICSWLSLPTSTTESSGGKRENILL